MKRNFHYSGTILWNSLPPNLKLIQNIDLFNGGVMASAITSDAIDRGL